MSDLRRTPLYEAHVEAGAKLVDFAGWEMPVQYEGIGAEHVAVREDAVRRLRRLPHGRGRDRGAAGARELLQRLLTNDVSKLEVGGGQYSCLCREDGGVLDDLFTYRLADDHYLTVTNASNHETRPGLVPRSTPRTSTPRSTTASTTTRCSPSRGRRPARSSARWPRASCRRASAPPT